MFKSAYPCLKRRCIHISDDRLLAIKLWAYPKLNYGSRGSEFVLLIVLAKHYTPHHNYRMTTEQQIYDIEKRVIIAVKQLMCYQHLKFS